MDNVSYSAHYHKKEKKREIPMQNNNQKIKITKS